MTVMVGSGGSKLSEGLLSLEKEAELEKWRAGRVWAAEIGSSWWWWSDVRRRIWKGRVERGEGVGEDGGEGESEGLGLGIGIGIGGFLGLRLGLGFLEEVVD